MRNVYSFLLICSLVLSPLAFSDDERVLCRNQATPPGWVIIEHKLVPGCGDYEPYFDNAKIVRLPAEKEWVCWDSPIPTGYYKVAGSEGMKLYACESSSPPNSMRPARYAFTIERLSDLHARLAEEVRLMMRNARRFLD